MARLCVVAYRVNSKGLNWSVDWLSTSGQRHSEEPLALSSPHHRNTKVLRRLLILLTVVVLLLPPVEYRAGAQQPHPHAILQLIWEASRGTPTHHVRAAMYPCALAEAAGHARMPEAPHRSVAGPANRYQPDVADAADGVRMSSSLLAAAFMPWLTCLVRLVSRTDRCWLRSSTLLVGVALSPEPPPPKILL